MTDTKALAPTDLTKVIADNARPPAERSDALRKLMLANASKITMGADKLFNAERAIQLACLSFRKNPRLLNCTLPSLFGAISEAATYGWTCDGILGHAYLIPFDNSKKQPDGSWKKFTECTLVPGYKGLRDLVRRSGECETVLESVHQGDEYEFINPFVPPRHVRSKEPSRKFLPVTDVYVLAQFTSGAIKCFTMTKEECIAHRDRYSKNFQSAKRYNKESESAWHEDHPEFRVMCMKTVLLEAIHRGELPMSVQAKSVADRELTIAESEQSTVEGSVVAAIELDLATDDEQADGDSLSATDEDKNVIDADAHENEQSDDELALAQLIDETIDSIKSCTEPDLIERISKTAIAAVKDRGGNSDLIASARQMRLEELKPKDQKGKSKQKTLA